MNYLAAFDAAFELTGGLLTLIILGVGVVLWLALVVMTIRRAR